MLDWSYAQLGVKIKWSSIKARSCEMWWANVPRLSPEFMVIKEKKNLQDRWETDAEQKLRPSLYLYQTLYFHQ